MSLRNAIGLFMVMVGLVAMVAGVILLVASERYHVCGNWPGIVCMALAFGLILFSPLKGTRDQQLYPSEQKEMQDSNK